MFRKGNAHILTKKELNKRYASQKDSHAAKLTAKAIQLGYSIARIEQVELGTFDCVLWDVQIALACKFPLNSKVEVWCFTDLTELDSGVVYCSFAVSSHS